MARIPFPTDGSIDVNHYSEALEFDVQLATTRNGRIVTRTLPGARWRVRMGVATLHRSNTAARGAAEALVASLRGGGNQLSMYNPWLVNRGTLAATTVKTAAGIGARSLVLNAPNGATLQPGDRLGLPSQRVIVLATAIGAAGQMTVSFEPELQANVAAGDAVVTVKPVSHYVMVDPLAWYPYSGGASEPIDLDLVEV